jgi:hypothetical protein
MDYLHSLIQRYRICRVILRTGAASDILRKISEYLWERLELSKLEAAWPAVGITRGDGYGGRLPEFERRG